jgi:hypothetical protein
MPSAPVHVAELPKFSGMGRSSQCGARFEIRVHFDRDCTEVAGGAHYHRICNSGHRWIEQASETGRPEFDE